jgi:hypothetical protein
MGFLDAEGIFRPGWLIASLDQLRAGLDADDLQGVYEDLAAAVVTHSDEYQGAAIERSLGAAGAYTRRLGSFDNVAWGQGLELLLRQRTRAGLAELLWRSSLVMTILLTFGAPFWFDMLRNLVNLKHHMSKPDAQLMRKMAERDLPSVGAKLHENTSGTPATAHSDPQGHVDP